jgi:Erv1 / Alr family
MTAIWGPLGWMALHSAASLYPDTPTPAEQQLMTKWLDVFRDTITCPSCQAHFTELLNNYRAQFPNMMYSRANFVLFTLRAHNDVNRRINKPVYSSVQACFDVLRNNVKFNTARSFRITYINHITRHWRVHQDMSGLAAMKKIHEMKKIEESYMAPRSNEFDVIIPEDAVIVNIGQQEAPSFSGLLRPRPFAAAGMGSRIMMTAQGLRLRR